MAVIFAEFRVFILHRNLNIENWVILKKEMYIKI